MPKVFKTIPHTATLIHDMFNLIMFLRAFCDGIKGDISKELDNWGDEIKDVIFYLSINSITKF